VLLNGADRLRTFPTEVAQQQRCEVPCGRTPWPHDADKPVRLAGQAARQPAPAHCGNDARSGERGLARAARPLDLQPSPLGTKSFGQLAYGLPRVVASAQEKARLRLREVTQTRIRRNIDRPLARL